MFVLIMCVPGEYSVLLFVPEIDLTRILLAIDSMLVADDTVG